MLANVLRMLVTPCRQSFVIFLTVGLLDFTDHVLLSETETLFKLIRGLDCTAALKRCLK